MFSTPIITALQDQLTLERQNAAAYRALAESAAQVNWPGAEKYLREASNEEQSHADKVAAYLVDRGIRPVYSALAGEAGIEVDNLPNYFMSALQLERTTTASLVDLYDLAETENDPQTCTFLIPLLNEQTEVERELTDFLLSLNRVDYTGWLVFDNNLK